MDVAQYTFQSPSANQVQVGRLDPSSVKQDEVKSENNKDTDKPKEVLQPLETDRLLDVYA